MRQHEIFEITLHGPILDANWACVDLLAEFSCNGHKKTVPGFYDGEGVYKVRFLPEGAGEYTWRVQGIVSGEGRETCESADDRRHGKVTARGHHFTYMDGTRYLPFGTTVYALAHQEDALVEETLRTLSEGPFNKVRMCVFPKDYNYNHNEPPAYPFEKNADGSWDVSRPSIAFWHRFESICDRIESMGIEIDLILFHPYDRWGFSSLGMENDKIYLDYLLRRLAARPGIWWSLANEYDIVRSLTMEDWFEIEDYVASHDPYGHLIGNHHCLRMYDHSRPNITHASLQTQLVEKATEYIGRFDKPVIYDEMCYEGDLVENWGNISGFELTNRFWQVCSQGGYATHGEVYHAQDEILWWAKGGCLHGESPARIGWLKELLSALPGGVEPGPIKGGMPGSFFQMLADPEKSAELMKKLPEEKKADARRMSEMLSGMSALDWELFNVKNPSYWGHVGEDAELHYFARTLPYMTELDLPEGASYRVEVLDVWEMTRKTALEKASGKVKVPLPGKEGIAVLATKVV